MKFKIIGSGGCVTLPKPLCQCPICIEAREKGMPYSRYGSSLYLEAYNLLVDTPEDIAISLNAHDIREVDSVLYTHLDPDHTLGLRVFEQLRLNWFEIFDGQECQNPISVYALPNVIEDINLIRSKYGAFMDYYEETRQLVKRKNIEKPLVFGELTITAVQIASSTIFVFEENGKKLIYAPCDIKPFPESVLFYDADILIIGDTIIGEHMKNDYILPRNSSMYDELFHIDEVIAIGNKYRIKEVIVTHIEEDWGKGYDALKAME